METPEYLRDLCDWFYKQSIVWDRLPHHADAFPSWEKTSIMKHGDANPLNLMNGGIEKKRLQLFVVLERVKNASDGEKRIE